MVLLIGLGFLTMFAGAMSAMVSDPCGSGIECNSDVIGAGVLTALVLPVVIILAGIVVTVVLLVLRRLAFWVPLVTAVLAIGALFLGFAIAVSGVPGTSL